MSAVWRAARAAVRRRRVQTFVIGLVVLLSTTTIVVALALLSATSAPFDKAFARQAGPHAIAVFSPAVTVPAGGPGVAASAGPFGLATVQADRSVEPGPRGPMTVVGRSDPAGPVDKLDLWEGRWPAAPGEIVLNEPVQDPGEGPPRPSALTAGGTTFTIVGRAHSLVGSADAWVTPEQVAALGPTGSQLLYRFTGDVSTKEAVEARLATATAGLPTDALLATQPYIAVKESVSGDVGAYVPFLATFGVLGLVVGIVIVGNVVSGAVVSGYRHIGILKALGFAPRQVVAVYLLMVSVPAAVGAVLGTALGAVAAQPLLTEGFQGLGLDPGIGVGPAIWVAGLVGVPVVVLLAALVPAVRAFRLSAAEAISAGSAPRAGRATRVQGRLAGLRLPRSISLGLGLPFARPGRTAFTVVAVLLGVTTVTFATGLADTLVRISTIEDRSDGQIAVQPSNGRIRLTPDGVTPAGPPVVTQRTDGEVEALLRSLPDAARVSAILNLPVSVDGQTEPLNINFVRGDYTTMGYADELTEGRWMTGAGETVVPAELMRARGLAVGDWLTLRMGAASARLQVVGEVMDGPSGPKGILTDWRVLTGLAPDRVAVPHEVRYQVQLVEGGDVAAYVRAVLAADPGLDVWDSAQLSDYLVTVVGFSSALALLLSAVAAVGVFNTVVLNVRERRRDLGMLKSIGMTPRQVVTMVLASVTLVGVLGALIGIPLGMVAHRLILPMTADAARVAIPPAVLDVWQVPTVALLAVAGVVIALLGALLPARGAARLRIAEVLHNE
ncbi:FtsX-like permease family protein [Asanoa sp. WMMD1127]|uniref:ABC transporter permease n=1 Tax=Asanoa sp. WMMD1127 TaxID=3016107 RepID=UPI002416AB37|nr:FtsX-like permease family protein [Asanoa sp. WMMD1127]MDG4820343.1 FtsX-like permease family protein [Asanoa sp. WMMD1127]